MKFENEQSVQKGNQEKASEQLIKERLVAFIGSGSIDSILRMKGKGEISDTILYSPEIQEAAKNRITTYTEQKRTEKVEQMTEALGFPSDFFQSSSVEESPIEKAESDTKNIDAIREKMREQLIEEILKEGGFRVNMCFERIVAKGQKNDGFQTVNEKIGGNYRSTAISEIVNSMITEKDGNPALKNIMGEHAINEVIDIRHIKERQYEKRKIPGKKGILGFGKTEDREDYVYDDKGNPKFTEYEFMHSELVENGKKEPAVRITYFVRKEGWKSRAHGRPGQEMEIELIIPESVAKGVEKELENNPEFIRKLSERIMKEKILEDSKAWDKAEDDDDKLRPQYEKWDMEKGGGRIYFQKEDDPRGWNESSVKRVKTTI